MNYVFSWKLFAVSPVWFISLLKKAARDISHRLTLWMAVDWPVDTSSAAFGWRRCVRQTYRHVSTLWLRVCCCSLTHGASSRSELPTLTDSFYFLTFETSILLHLFIWIFH